jgi:dihydrofolate reductase
MARIVATEFISIDGVMEAPGGGENEDYRHAGWSFEIGASDEGARFKLSEALSADALLLGRKTYEGFAASWPSAQGEFADKFNGMPKYVITSTLQEGSWNNTTLLKGDVVDEVSTLKRAPGGDIVIYGSATVVQTLLEHGLIDELRLMVIPVVLGSGRTLFGAAEDKTRMRLKETKIMDNGVVILIYEPFGETP